MDTSKNWRTIGQKKRSGVLAPLFSIYSSRSMGIGDFHDLKLLVDWCADTGNSIIQLLPLNEVAGNFSPYESISSFALEPLFAAVSRKKDNPFFEKLLSFKRVDYGVKEVKLLLLRKSFNESVVMEEGKIQEFRSENSWWIEDFALFKVLKKRFGGAPWYDWPDSYRQRDPGRLASFRAQNLDEINFEIWIQFFLKQQLCEAKSYAAARGVFIMGDLPLLISRDSADVWAHTEFFNMSLVAGAPPDMFTVKGQRWGNPGMPVYKWHEIEKDGFRYIREKLRYAGQFYDMLRIDHVVGLFRIWSIPFDEPLENGGLNGSFMPSDETLWGGNGRERLSVMLNSTEMLLCGEDLGAIPPVCPLTMEELGIPGIDVQRWSKDWRCTGKFLKQHQYRSLGVSALSTHDTSNWKTWWENEASSGEREQLLHYFGLEGAGREEADAGLSSEAMRFILGTNSIFSIQLIFDWLNLDGSILGGRQDIFRINEPGIVSPANWSAVLPMPLEELINHRVSLCARRLVSESGRL